MSTTNPLLKLLSAIARGLRAQIVREHHALLEERIAWGELGPARATIGAPGGLMTPRRPRLRRPEALDALEALWALPAHEPLRRHFH